MMLLGLVLLGFFWQPQVTVLKINNTKIKRLAGAFFVDINSILCYTHQMKINRALDWNQVSSNLSSQMNGIGYNPDLHRMHKNIDKMVTELSKLEVNLRRTGKFEMLNDRVVEINNAINHLEKLVLMANLMK